MLKRIVPITVLLGFLVGCSNLDNSTNNFIFDFVSDLPEHPPEPPTPPAPVDTILPDSTLHMMLRSATEGQWFKFTCIGGSAHVHIRDSLILVFHNGLFTSNLYTRGDSDPETTPEFAYRDTMMGIGEYGYLHRFVVSPFSELEESYNYGPTGNYPWLWEGPNFWKLVAVGDSTNLVTIH
jgi:hypothetical protein